MKKVASIISGVALLATVSTSCKKSHTCECTYTCSVLGTSTSLTESFTTKDTKKKAKAWCDQIQRSHEGGGCSASCSLK